MASLTVRVPVAAPPETVFRAMVELESQDRWILGTTLFEMAGPVPVPEVGSRMAALTGLFGFGVLDLMEVTRYDPPGRWETVHLGRLIRGRGVFAVEPAADGAVAAWTEEVELPLGLLGRVGWVFARPVVGWGLRASLRRLARGVESGTLPPAPPS